MTITSQADVEKASEVQRLKLMWERGEESHVTCKADGCHYHMRKSGKPKQKTVSLQEYLSTGKI